MRSFLLKILLSTAVLLASPAEAKRSSHQLTLPSVHGSQTLFLSEISHQKSKGHFVALYDQRKNETLYERIEKKDYQNRVNRLLKIIESDIKKTSKRNPSSFCYEKIRYSFQVSGQVKKEFEFCWDQLANKQKNNILRWWKTGL